MLTCAARARWRQLLARTATSGRSWPRSCAKTWTCSTSRCATAACTGRWISTRTATNPTCSGKRWRCWRARQLRRHAALDGIAPGELAGGDAGDAEARREYLRELLDGLDAEAAERLLRDSGTS